MLNRRYIAVFCLALSVLFAGNAYAQKTTKRAATKKPTKEALQGEAKKLQSQISYNKKMLDETQKDKKANLTQLSILNDQLVQRDKLIKTISTELRTVESEIKDYERQIAGLEDDVKALKDEYAKIIVATQRHLGFSDRALYILASDDFNQAMRRIKYFQQYSAHRKNQVVLIKDKQEELEAAKKELELLKTDKVQLLSKEQQEKKSLDTEKNNKNKLLSQLQSKEKDLRAKIKKDQDNVNKLNKQIEKLIAEEVERARKEAERRAKEEAAKAGKKPPTTFALTPEEQKLSNDFVSNRGKLPWPTERGLITGFFGTHDHPAMKGIKVNNSGIDIMTNKGATARAVFDGTITTIFTTPTGSKLIIVQHGNYRTVYSNLCAVSVKVGDKVKTKQDLGTICTDDEEGKTVLQFQVWKDKEKMNPVHWIVAR